MTTMHTDEKIGEAWRLHREGKNSAAVRIFEEILNRTPDHIDANYGLGLAMRGEGNAEGAMKHFKRAQELSNNALNAVKTASSVDGHVGGNDLDTYDDDRYMMLVRMTGQRITELEASSGS